MNSVNPLSLLGAARVADSVDDVVEAGSQVGVAAVRGTSPLTLLFHVRALCNHLNGFIVATYI